MNRRSPRVAAAAGLHAVGPAVPRLVTELLFVAVWVAAGFLAYRMHRHFRPKAGA